MLRKQSFNHQTSINKKNQISNITSHNNKITNSNQEIISQYSVLQPWIDNQSCTPHINNDQDHQNFLIGKNKYKNDDSQNRNHNKSRTKSKNHCQTEQKSLVYQNQHIQLQKQEQQNKKNRNYNNHKNQNIIKNSSNDKKELNFHNIITPNQINNINHNQISMKQNKKQRRASIQKKNIDIFFNKNNKKNISKHSQTFLRNSFTHQNQRNVKNSHQRNTLNYSSTNQLIQQYNKNMANLNENDEVYRKQQINQNTFQGQLIQNHQQENNYNLNNPVIKISKKFEKFDKFLKSKRNKKVTSSKVLQTVDIQDNSGSFVNISEKSKNFENDNKNNKIIQNNLQKSHQLKVSKNKNFTQILRRSSFRNAQSLQKTNINKNQPQIEPCYSNISNIMSKEKKLLKKKLIILHKYSFLKGNSLFKTGKSFEKQRSLEKKQSNPLMPINIQKKSDILSKQNEISNKNNQNLNNTNYIFNILQKFHKECYINAKQQQPRISFFQKLKNEKELKNQSQKYLYKSSNKKINLNNISSQKLKLQFQSNIQAFQKTCHGLLAVGFSKEQNERDKEYKNYHTMSKNYNFKNGLNKNTKSLFVMPVHSISDQQKGALVVNIKIDAQADNNVISNLNISDSQKILLTPKGKNPFKSHNQSLKKQLKSLRKMKLQKQQRLIQRKIKISMDKNRNSLDPKRSISIFNYPTVMSQKQ